jgi:hypothetical protein
LVQEKKNMKRFRKFRDPRFALTTLQNPSWEVRTRAELIQAAQDALAHQPDAADFPFAGRPAAPGISPPATTTPTPVAAAPLDEPQPLPQAQSEREPEPQPETETEPETQTETETELEPQLELQSEPASHPNPPAESLAAPPACTLPKIVAKHRAKRKHQSGPQPELQPPPVHFSKIIPGEGAAEYVADSLDRHADKASGPHRQESSALPDLKRHARKCAICRHPNRADIEEAFVSWRNAELIQKDYKLSNYHTIYRHARAQGLYERRRENLHFAAELLIEHADQARPDANIILRAIHACARINDRGEWIEPARRLIVSSSAELAAPAPEPHKFVPETHAHPQFSAPVSTSTDGVNPQFLINVPPIKK